ncbi:toxic anion resistance protein [Campylobacterota bacterium DY0563]
MKNSKNESLELLISGIENQSLNLIENSQNKVFEDSLSEEDESKIKNKAKDFLEFISNKDAEEIRRILENILIDDIKDLEKSSELLMAKVAQLDSIKDSESSNIANTIIKLNSEISDINPHKYNLNSSGVLSLIPFVGKPIDRYLKKFKSAKELIIETINYLEEGEQLLKDDNIVLQHDKKRYRETALKLQKKAFIFEEVISTIEENLVKLKEDDRVFYENNLLLNLHKKTRSIYEILVVTQQGFLSSDLIINTNWELIDNISNVRIVTKRALESGVAMLVALENQKNVITAVEKTKDVTNDLIISNSKRMNEQASEIYINAGKGTINIDTLKESFNQIDEAISKINSYKLNAIIKIKDEVGTLKNITNQLEEKMKDAELEESFKASFSLEI